MARTKKPATPADEKGTTPYERIRAAIRSGQLQPGSRVTETNLAEWLGVSRTPIREAILRLEQEGLFTYAPRQGLTVAELNYEAVVELYAMREVLEGTAASLAARHASDAEIDMLNEVLEEERGLGDDDAAQAAATNRQFHQILYYAAHNRFLQKSLDALSDAMMLLGPTTLAAPERHRTALDEHARIVAAISARDSDTAETAARAHIRAAQRYRLKQIISQGASTPD